MINFTDYMQSLAEILLSLDCFHLLLSLLLSPHIVNNKTHQSNESSLLIIITNVDAWLMRISKKTWIFNYTQNQMREKCCSSGIYKQWDQVQQYVHHQTLVNMCEEVKWYELTLYILSGSVRECTFTERKCNSL